MTKDVLNKDIEEICEEYSDEGLMKLLPTLKDEYNRLAVVDPGGITHLLLLTYYTDP